MPATDYRTLCLIHGWGFDKRVLAGFAEKYLPEWNVINLSLPGYSGAVYRATGIEDIARALLPEVPTDAVLIGWSLGGMIGIRIAAMKQVRHLVLLASTPCFVARTDWPHGIDPELVQDLARRVKVNTGNALREFALLSSRGDNSPGATYRELTASLEYNGAGALLDGLDILRTADLRREFSGLQCPVGTILAANDALVSASMAGALKSLRPGLEPDIIAAAGHAPFISAPEQIRKSLLTLLSHTHA